jgi:serine/threonine-protein kinase
VVGLVLGGAGVIAIGAGAFFGLKASSTYDDALALCNPSNQCKQRGLDLADDATSQATVSTIAFVAGGVLLAGGAVLYLTAPRARVSLGGPGLAGMTVGGVF